MPFYRDLLGFRLSDYFLQAVPARYLHARQSAPSQLAFIADGQERRRIT